VIHYHGGPFSPESAARHAWGAGHAFVSFAAPTQLPLAAQICQSFALDNGAFSLWRAKKPTDWPRYYAWVDQWRTHPGFDFAVIPDVIAGGEEENDALLAEWPHGPYSGAPVWHTDESPARLARLAAAYPRVCVGSSGKYDVKHVVPFLTRMEQVLRPIVDQHGRPPCRLHGLRMLNPLIFTLLPLASADSTNVSRNARTTSLWPGTYRPASTDTRALVLAERIESYNSAPALLPGQLTGEQIRANALLQRLRF